MDKFLKFDSTATVEIPEENWEHGYRPTPNRTGTKVTVKGYAEIFHSRIQSFGKTPGIYENPYWVHVQDESGKEWTEANNRLTPDNPDSYGKREPKFIRDLPDTLFWEGDQITVKDRPEITIVVGIEYDMPGLYRCSDSFDGGWHTSSREDTMTLVARGNIWKYFHKKPIAFPDIGEEASFFKMLGHYEEMKNPLYDLYKWTKEEFLDALQKDLVDGMTMGGAFFGNPPRISAIRFTDRDLGRRVRKCTLKGFNVELKVS